MSFEEEFWQWALEASFLPFQPCELCVAALGLVYSCATCRQKLWSTHQVLFTLHSRTQQCEVTWIPKEDWVKWLHSCTSPENTLVSPSLKLGQQQSVPHWAPGTSLGFCLLYPSFLRTYLSAGHCLGPFCTKQTAKRSLKLTSSFRSVCQ